MQIANQLTKLAKHEARLSELQAIVNNDWCTKDELSRIEDEMCDLNAAIKKIELSIMFEGEPL